MVTGPVRRISKLAEGVAIIGTVPSFLSGLYLGGLTVWARPKRPLVGDRSVRFAVVIPAHNEALGIAQTVSSVLALDYPDTHRKIIVVADNCDDTTAQVAKDAGAEVIERFDALRKSKGFALTDAFPEVLSDPWVDAIVVIDADTTVESNLLSCFAAHFAAGAQVAQANYAVANPKDGWRTELMDVAFTCFHDVRSLGREALHLSCGLRGNGMAFTRHALELVPHAVSSLVEDLEYGILLAKSGIRVTYAHDTRVWAEMPNNDEAAQSQRERWERGRKLVRREHGVALLKEALSYRDPVRADLAADVLLPPVTTVVRVAGLTLLGSIVQSGLRRRPSWSLLPSGIGALGLVFHVFTGWKRSRAGGSAIKSLPGYVRWKANLTSEGKDADTTWVRTKRNAEQTPTQTQERENVKWLQS